MKKRSVFLVLIVLIFIPLLYYLFKPRLNSELVGGNTSIEVFSDYQDKGVKSYYGNLLYKKKVNPNVEVINNINKDKLGDYEITYKIKYKKKKNTLTRKVTVIDSTAPELTLESNKIDVCPNSTDYNLKYQAIDNYDGDITNNVVKNIKDNIISLSISDSSNNTTTKEVLINYQDIEKPNITLSGSNTSYLYLGSTYKEPGYKATDNCSGNLTNKVVITNNINNQKTGTYYVTYKVTDEYNNTTTVKRTVKVIANQTTEVKGNKIIYLTFDDGPSAYTNELLDILKQYNVKATFFVTWQQPNYSSSIKRAYDEGHSIGLHTYSHNYYKVYSSVDAYFNDLNAISNQVKNIIGVEPKLIRFPGGSSNTVSRITPKIMTTLSNEVQARGYKYFDWNISSNDTSSSNSQTIANNVIKCLKGGTYIVLQHDTKQASVRAVKTIIEYALSNGYTFLPLDMTSPTIHHTINN